MLSEQELQAIRDKLTKPLMLTASETWNVGEDLRRLLDHIDSTPKPPQVFGEISEEELTKVEKAARNLPGDEWNAAIDGGIIELEEITHGTVCVFDAHSDQPHGEDVRHANAIVCILNTLPKLLATIRTQAALLRDLQEDSAAVREALHWREIVERQQQAMKSAITRIEDSGALSRSDAMRDVADILDDAVRQMCDWFGTVDPRCKYHNYDADDGLVYPCGVADCPLHREGG